MSQHQPFWVVLIILLSISAIGYLRAVYYNRFKNFFRALFISRFANKLYREEFALTNPVSLYLSVVFVLIGALFCIQASMSLFAGSMVTLSLFALLWICFIILAVYTVKTIFFKILGFILHSEFIIDEYLFTTFLINQGIGIFLLPIVIIYSYGGESIKYPIIIAGLIIVAVFYIFRIGRGVTLAIIHSGISPFYLFLYLCSLEIFPLLLGIKLFQKLI